MLLFPLQHTFSDTVPSIIVILSYTFSGDGGLVAKSFSNHLTNLLKKQAKITLETIVIKGADANYSAPADLRQMYNDFKAYVGREDTDTKLL